MQDQPSYRLELDRFLGSGGFAADGAVITDLDGTAVHEREGRIYIPPTVEAGLKRIHDRGGSVVINTLRFPLSVIRVFGAEWYRVTGDSIPLVSLKGSQYGHVVASSAGELAFEEIGASPLAPSEVEEVLKGIDGMVRDGVADLLVFYYPRDWRQGEIIWSPSADRVAPAREKYLSASRVYTSSVAELRDALLAQPLCMIFLLINEPQDRLMAYQHTHRTSFVTHKGVDKRHGAEAIARHLGIALDHSFGAGDAETDSFLAAVGFAVIVGNNELEFKGVHHTVRLPDVAALGDLLYAVGDSLG